LTGGASDGQPSLAERLQELGRRRQELLKQNGIPDDYLEPYYHCPVCKDTGFTDGQPCVCCKKLIISYLYSYSNLTQLEEQSFDNLDMNLYPDDVKIRSKDWSVREFMGRIVDFCKKYAENFSDQNADSLLITGNTGTSKTFLSGCIAHAVMDRGFSVLYLPATEVFTILRQNTWAFQDEDEAQDENNDRTEMLFSCDLLIVDDLGTEPATAHTSSYFFHLINKRLVEKKSTILTSNHTPDQLRRTYTERVVDRIISAPYTHLSTTDGADFNVRRALKKRS
ncbi:MAG: ATP-binding protein, partial [Lachnospiraceae bacterium]|nr:ATP-binding protein [Lachnospiraceae bacterium]